ncbi:MAG TPA: VanZ family protein [Mucilaginibacter sp.]
MKGTLKYYWPAILWALFILLLCSVKINEAPHSSLFFPGFDKLVHCGLFFVMTVFLSAGATRKQSAPGLSYKALLVVIIASIVYGGLIELSQACIFTWRDGDWNDLFADTIGVLMGAFSIFITAKALSYDKS